jgi:hypothetical protein
MYVLSLCRKIYLSSFSNHLPAAPAPQPLQPIQPILCPNSLYLAASSSAIGRYHVYPALGALVPWELLSCIPSEAGRISPIVRFARCAVLFVLSLSLHIQGTHTSYQLLLIGNHNFGPHSSCNTAAQSNLLFSAIYQARVINEQST